MNEKHMGKCGFYCGSCPTFNKGDCLGCIDAHEKGDCYTRDCVIEKGIDYCGKCSSFPCEHILENERCTVLDKSWLRWKKSEK
ncbi:MAG: DUF3795 domain-containing protein [Clostridia bacterium]|nr:DUF3795 domain-containing protein [Clostridia bacterium]